MSGCPTGKRRHATELDAKVALMLLPENERRAEQRCYWCDKCCGWHLISQPKKDQMAHRRKRK